MANLKRPKLAAMLFAAALCPMLANGETITYYNNENPDDILNSSQFEIDSYLETATLTKFQDWYYDENVVIPETFEYDGTTYTITAIGEEAFFSEYGDYDDILTLTIPETVTTFVSEDSTTSFFCWIKAGMFSTGSVETSMLLLFSPVCHVAVRSSLLLMVTLSTRCSTTEQDVRVVATDTPVRRLSDAKRTNFFFM